MMVDAFKEDPWLQDGGPAFPLSIPVEAAAESYKGMSLRDWFAGQALTGIIANPSEPDGVESDADMRRLIARVSYEYADAMLAARNKKSEG